MNIARIATTVVAGALLSAGGTVAVVHGSAASARPTSIVTNGSRLDTPNDLSERASIPGASNTASFPTTAPRLPMTSDEDGKDVAEPADVDDADQHADRRHDDDGMRDRQSPVDDHGRDKRDNGDNDDGDGS